MAPVFFKHVVGRESWEVHAHRCATRAWRAASSGHILDKSSPFAKVVAHLLLIVNLALRAAGSRPSCRHGQAAALPRPSTLSARLARQKPRRAVGGNLAQASSQSGWSGQGCSHSIQSVEEAAAAAPHRAWPWPLTPAQPHPVRPLPERPEATVHAPSLFSKFARKSCCRKTGKQPAAHFEEQGITTESTSSERCERTVSPVRRHAP